MGGTELSGSFLRSFDFELLRMLRGSWSRPEVVANDEEGVRALPTYGSSKISKGAMDEDRTHLHGLVAVPAAYHYALSA